MKKLFKKIFITAVSVFSFLFAFFAFASNDVKAYDGRQTYNDYFIYEVTIPSVNMYEYSFNESDGSITIYSNTVFTKDLKFSYLGKFKSRYTTDLHFKSGDFFLKGIHSLDNGTYYLQQQINIEEPWWKFSNNLELRNRHDHYTMENVYGGLQSCILADYLFIFYDDATHGAPAGKLDYLINVDEFYQSILTVEQNYETYVVNVSLDYKSSDNQDIIDNYITENNYHSNEEYLEYGNSKYETGFVDGQTSVDVTDNDEEIYTEAYQEGRDDGYTIGFEDGKNSVDIETVKQEYYDKGYNNGYNVGFADGEYSVDITKDNDQAIDIWLTQNKYYTQLEFDNNFELGFNSGKEYVYVNIENDEVVKEYVNKYIVENKYYTEKEYVDNFVSGKEYVYKNIESDPIIKEYYKTKYLNNLKIDLSTKEEVVKVIKLYDVNVDDTGQTHITIHYGQDNYELKTETIVEVVPGESEKDPNAVDYSSSEVILSMVVLAACVVVGIILIFWLISKLGSKKINFTSSKYKTLLKKRRNKGGNKYAKKI